MLTAAEIEQYKDLGYLVVPGVLDRDLLAEVRRTVDAIVADAAQVTQHTDVYDLEDSHSPQAPRVRRIKTPHKHFPRASRRSWRNCSARTSACTAPSST
jgi:phytanoyl-CoA hydroxylase